MEITREEVATRIAEVQAEIEEVQAREDHPLKAMALEALEAKLLRLEDLYEELSALD